jgi:hypothetical protein
VATPFPFTGKIIRVLVDMSEAELQKVVALSRVAMEMQ